MYNDPSNPYVGVWQSHRQRDFSGGENLRIMPEVMAKNQVVRALNCVINDSGQLETRLGKVKINTSSFGASPILGVWRYVKENGSKFLVVQHNTSVWAAAWDGVSTIGVWSEVKTGLTTDKLSAVVWKDNLILGNGVNNMFRFDGVSCVDLGGSPPKMKVFTVYAGKIWGVDANNPSRLRISGLEDYNLWNATDVIIVRDQDGDQIKGLQPSEGGLAILKDTSIWPLYGSSKSNLRLGVTPISDSAGCVSSEGSLPYGVCFGGDNIYSFGLTKVTPVADTHVPLFDELTPAEKSAVIVGVQPKYGRLFFHFPNGVTLVGDAKREAITTWSGLNANCFAVADGEGDDGRLIVGDATTGDVYMLSGADDAGVAIATEIITRYDNLGTEIDKIWRRYQPDVSMLEEGAYSITCKHDIDYRASVSNEVFAGVAAVNPAWQGGDIWEDAVWGDRSEVDIDYWPTARGEVCSFRLSVEGRIMFNGFKTVYRHAGGHK